MIYRKMGNTDVRISILSLGGHEYLPNGRSRGFNENLALAVKPGYIFEGFGGGKRKKVLSTAVYKVYEERKEKQFFEQ